MDFTFSLLAAIAVIVSLATAIFVIWETVLLWTAPRATQRAFATQVGAVMVESSAPIARAMCEPDGVAITTIDRLRMLITSLDVMVVKGKYTVQQVTALADQFARNQPAPDVVLAKIQNCEPWLQETHGYGYGILTSALVRAAVARRNEPGHPSPIRAAVR